MYWEEGTSVRENEEAAGRSQNRYQTMMPV